MAELIEQLKALELIFAELLTISRPPALFLGILHHFGRRDASK